jgi:hypothetical protein
LTAVYGYPTSRIALALLAGGVAGG